MYSIDSNSDGQINVKDWYLEPNYKIRPLAAIRTYKFGITLIVRH